MNRPLVALALTAVALGLLAVLVADLEQAVENPDFQIGEKGAKAAVDAADKLGGSSAADGLRLPEGATFRIPEGAEIDGDLLRLLAAMEWAVPAGGALDNLSMELPAGLDIQIPDGTWADGDTLVFPANSTVVLDDGTQVRLPQGGTLTMPGASGAELRHMLHSGVATTKDGSVFWAPSAVPGSDWPITFPAGTTFELPEGHGLKQGPTSGGETISFPAGETIQPKTAGGKSGDSWLAGLGDLDFSSGGPSSASKALSGLGGGLAGFGGLGTVWWWVLAGLVLLVLAWQAWRYRNRLIPGRRTAAAHLTAAGTPSVRLVWTVARRPTGLPLAFLPGAVGPATLLIERYEAEAPPPAPGTDRTNPAEPGVRQWVATAAEVELTIDGAPWYSGPVPADGQKIAAPTGPAGAEGLHLVRAQIRLRARGALETCTGEMLVATWDEHVAHAYQLVYDHARVALALPDETTPRALGQALQRALPGLASLVEPFVLVFEKASYSAADVTETQWIHFAQTAARLHEALDARVRDGAVPARPASTAAAAPAAPARAGRGGKPVRGDGA